MFSKLNCHPQKKCMERYSVLLLQEKVFYLHEALQVRPPNLFEKKIWRLFCLSKYLNLHRFYQSRGPPRGNFTN